MWIYLVIPVVIGFIIYNAVCKKVVIYDYEKGLLFRKGKFIKLLDAGLYRVFRNTSVIQKIDMRVCFATIPGQEVLSSDSITLKVSLAAQYEIADPVIALTKIASYYEAFYLMIQLALREIIGSKPIDDIMQKRSELCAQIIEKCREKAKTIGINLIDVNIKDIMFPGELKKIFSREVEARKESMASLEKTRGETAALRNLANAAKMVQDNPALLQLRALGTSGNTIVFGMANTVLPVKKDEK